VALTPALCRFCGQPADLTRGCVIRLGWSTEVGGYTWAHRVCMPQAVATPPGHHGVAKSFRPRRQEARKQLAQGGLAPWQARG